MFDQAMLIRERRRFRNIGGIMGGATAIALWLFIAWPLLLGSPSGDETTRAAWAVGAAGVLGCLIAFASAAAVIRREASGHTLESLLVTNQQSRPVVTSIVLVAALRGGVLTLLTLLTLFFTHEPTIHHAAGLFAAFILIAVCLFIAAGLGVVVSITEVPGLVAALVATPCFIAILLIFSLNPGGCGPNSFVSFVFVDGPATAGVYFIIREWLTSVRAMGERPWAQNRKSAFWTAVASFWLTRLLLVIVMGDVDWRFTGVPMGTNDWLIRANPLVVAARLGGEWYVLVKQNQVPAIVFLALHGMIVAAGLVCCAAQGYRRMRVNRNRIGRQIPNGEAAVISGLVRPWRCGRNPVLSRELRWWRPVIHATAVITGILLIIALVVTNLSQELMAFLLLGGGILFPALLGVYADTQRPIAIWQEQEMGMLLSSRLTAHEILVGKLAGAFAPMAISAVPVLPVILIGLLFGRLPRNFATGVFCLTLTYSLTLAALYVIVPILVRRASFRLYLLIVASMVFGIAWFLAEISWSDSSFEAAFLRAIPILLTAFSGVLWLLAIRRLRTGGAL